MYRIGQEGGTGNEACCSPSLSPGFVEEKLIHGSGGNHDVAGSSSATLGIVGLSTPAAKAHIHLHRWENKAILKLHATNGYRLKYFHCQHPLNNLLTCLPPL
jgi:hypothetical protein